MSGRKEKDKSTDGGRQDILTSYIHTYIGWGLFPHLHISLYIYPPQLRLCLLLLLIFFKFFLPLNKIKEERLDGRRKCEQASNYPPRIRGWALICRPTLRNSRERGWKSSQRKVIRLIRAWSGSNGWVFAFRSMDGNNPRMGINPRMESATQHIKQKVPVRVSFITFLANSLQLRFFLCLICTPQFATHHAQ